MQKSIENKSSFDTPPQIECFSIGTANIPFLKLIEKPTPIVSGQYADHKFLVKREDLTDTTVYGGNKVRNLEFILADALLKDKQNLSTPIPVGSNFSAAFAGHSKRFGFDPLLCQVALADHLQIKDHLNYCKNLNTRMITRSGFLRFPLQAVDVAKSVISHHAYFVPPGGSNILGALGHLKGFLEIKELVLAGKIQAPKTIYVGAGTGGTTAGILAGITLSGFKTKVIAVRCAEKIICNKSRILNLANRTLEFIGSGLKVDESSLELIECPGSDSYGQPLEDFSEIFENFGSLNGVEVDRTYTSKVVKAMAHHMKTNSVQDDSCCIYWHTFSSMASQESQRTKLNFSQYIN